MQWTYGGGTEYVEVDADTGDGGLVTYEGRFQTLLDCCKTCGRIQNDPGSVADELDFWIDNTVDGHLTFSTISPTDKTDSTTFSTKLGNIRAVDYTENRPTVNALMCGGPEVEAGNFKGPSTRIFAYTGTTASVASMAAYGMIEGFYDWSGADTDDSLADKSLNMKTAGRAEVDTKCYDITVKITLEEDPMYNFMDDFDIGYIVNVQIDDMTYTDMIREIEFVVDPNSGEVVSPTVASPTRFRPKERTSMAAYETRRRLIDSGRFK